MKLPHIDLEELRKIKEENLKDRLAFIEKYVVWLKQTPNKKWSAQRKIFTDKGDHKGDSTTDV